MAVSGLALIADALGGLAGKSLTGYRFSILGICVLLVLLSALLVGTIVASESSSGTLAVALLSLGAFSFCLIASFAAKLVG
jgi:hypothetical protein